MKKKICILFCLAALALILSGYTFDTENSYVSGDYTYVLSDENNAMITKYAGREEEVTVPETLDGYSVVALGEAAFRYNYRLITIPDCVTELEPHAFGGYSPEVYVSPDHPTLATINGVLFEKSTKKLISFPAVTADDADLHPELAEGVYVIPYGIREIGPSAFAACTVLKEIIIPDTVTTIGSWAFAYCTGVKNVKLPAGLTEIGDHAFSYSDVESIEIPSGITVIEDSMFAGTALKSIILPDSITSIGRSAFEQCYMLEEITLPEGLTTIGDRAFSLAIELTKVNIPSSVVSIGTDAFANYNLELTLTVEHDSYAAQYCRDAGLNYTYPDSLDWLTN